MNDEMDTSDKQFDKACVNYFAEYVVHIFRNFAEVGWC